MDFRQKKDFPLASLFSSFKNHYARHTSPLLCPFRSCFSRNQQSFIRSYLQSEKSQPSAGQRPNERASDGAQGRRKRDDRKIRARGRLAEICHETSGSGGDEIQAAYKRKRSSLEGDRAL